MEQQPQQRVVFNPTTADITYTEDEKEFMLAMDRYKKSSRRPYPTWHEVLTVLLSLGYRKVEPAEPLPKFMRNSGGKAKHSRE